MSSPGLAQIDLSVLQCDEFAPDAMTVREQVITGGFTTETGPDGAQYTGISKYPVPQWYARLAAMVRGSIVPKLSCFRLNLKGELPHSWVHSDDICASYATVLYLNPPEQCFGGTAFWRHKDLNISRLPGREELLKHGADPEAFYRMVNQEWKRKEPWEQIWFIEMQWNRLITYPTCFFHSRYPFEGFGSGPADGRLIWICFYDIAGEMKEVSS